MKRTKIGTVRSVAGIKDPYIKRILSYIVGKDAFNIYRQTPSQLKHLLKGLSERQLRTPPAKGRWSIAQIVSHLYDTEVVLGFRYRMAIAQPGAPLQAFDENKWASSLRYNSADCEKKLELLIKMRRDHITLLSSLSKKEWKHYGMHEERGKETVERMVQLEAGHDINHLRQIEIIRRLFLKQAK
ncbi:MAG: DinB family protein [Ignavibacteriae bacterium]|nr:DinB family protein [Ignavibacteriota bacterium]